MIDFEYGRNITEGSAGPDMTPMIDMIFQLLIFFLLTSFFILPGRQCHPAQESHDRDPAAQQPHDHGGARRRPAAGRAAGCHG